MKRLYLMALLLTACNSQAATQRGTLVITNNRSVPLDSLSVEDVTFDYLAPNNMLDKPLLKGETKTLNLSDKCFVANVTATFRDGVVSTDKKMGICGGNKMVLSDLSAADKAALAKHHGR